MSTLSWKTAPLLALLALGLFALLPGGPGRPTAVQAYDCASGNTGTLRVDIIDDNTNERITVPGVQLTFDPDTQDGVGTDPVTDNSAEDNSTATGRIQQNDTCSTEGAEEYSATISDLPAILEDNCDVVNDSDSGTVSDSGTTTLEIHLDCQDFATATPTTTATTTATVTPTATTTPTGATGVTVSAAPSTVNCSGSSFVTVVVKSGSANVADGTTVSVSSTSGTLSPTSAPTSGGGILTIFTAGSTSGTATITASAGGATGTTSITVNCGAPTAVPPPPPPPAQPTAAPSGGIRPPNTGDAGLAADDGANWLAIGVVALVVTSAAGGLVLARRRA